MMLKVILTSFLIIKFLHALTTANLPVSMNDGTGPIIKKIHVPSQHFPFNKKEMNSTANLPVSKTDVFGQNATADDQTLVPRERWYNESLIAKKFALMAAGSYGNEDQVRSCLAKVLPDANLSKFVERPCPIFVMSNFGRHFLCAAFVAISHSDKVIILAFRGSLNFWQVLDEIAASLLVLWQPPAAPAGIANLYFVNTFNVLTERTGLLEHLSTLHKLYPDYEIWITGHSMGGAVASLAAGKLVKEMEVNETNLKLVTFGQPRTGNEEWANEMDNLIKTYKYRVVSGNDLVPHVPFTLGFTLTIPWEWWPSWLPRTFEIKLGEKWVHSTGEVWYQNGAKIGDQFKMCNTTKEQADCSGVTEIPKQFVEHFIGMLISFGFDCGLKISLKFWKIPFIDILETLTNCISEKMRDGKEALVHSEKLLGLNPIALIRQHNNNFGIAFNSTDETGVDGCNAMWKN